MYGGYGGYSGLGGGYSGYGGLGSSYGGYTSSFGRGYGTESTTRQLASSTKQSVEADPNKPADPQGQRQQQDKKVVEEWFKMMGGLRSILQLGVAFLALANFCMTTSQLVKKFMEFSKDKVSSIAKYIESKIPTKAISTIMSPQRRYKILKEATLMILRILAAFLLVLGIKMRRDLRLEAQRKHQETLLQLKKLRDNQIELEDEKDIEARQLKLEQAPNQDANL